MVHIAMQKTCLWLYTLSCPPGMAFFVYYPTENGYPDGGECHAADLLSVLSTQYVTLCLLLSRE